AEVRERPGVQRGELARERHLFALEHHRQRPRRLIARGLRLERGAMVRILPLEREEFLVVLAAQLLEQRRTPPARELPLELGERRRELGIESQAARGQLGPGSVLLPSAAQ